MNKMREAFERWFVDTYKWEPEFIKYKDSDEFYKYATDGIQSLYVGFESGYAAAMNAVKEGESEEVCYAGQDPKRPIDGREELRERCGYYERTNVLQGEMLNEAIAERDNLTMVLAERTVERDELQASLAKLGAAFAKYATEDPIEQARRLA